MLSRRLKQLSDTEQTIVSGVLKNLVSVLLGGFCRLQLRSAIKHASPEKAVGRPDETQRYMLFLLPIWVLAGVADYLAPPDTHRDDQRNRREHHTRADDY